MRILKNEKEIKEALAEEDIHPAQATLSDMMKNKIYQCGCGSSHPVDTTPVGAACRGRSIAHSGVGKGFILMCNTHATLVVQREYLIIHLSLFGHLKKNYYRICFK